MAAVVITDAALKHTIRVEGEKEAETFYSGRALQGWLDALAPLGNDARKPFLPIAPDLVAIFEKTRSPLDDGRRDMPA